MKTIILLASLRGKRDTDRMLKLPNSDASFILNLRRNNHRKALIMLYIELKYTSIIPKFMSVNEPRDPSGRVHIPLRRCLSMTAEGCSHQESKCRKEVKRKPFSYFSLALYNSLSESLKEGTSSLFLSVG